MAQKLKPSLVMPREVILHLEPWEEILLEYPDGSSFRLTTTDCLLLFSQWGVERPDRIIDFLWNFHDVKFLPEEDRYFRVKPRDGGQTLLMIGSKVVV